MKLGIILDSSASLSKKEAEERGWILLPLIMTINGKDYLDGIDITTEKFYNTIKISDDVKTSATPPGIMSNEIERASKMYDHVIVYPLSNGLSSQNSTLKLIASDFENVHVIDSMGVGYAIVRDLEFAEQMMKDGHSIDEIVNKLNELTKKQDGIAIPETMKWLVKGGRVSSAAAAMANLLKIVPMVSFKDGVLDKHDKSRVFKKAVIKAGKFLKNKNPSNEMILYVGNINDQKEITSSLNGVFGDFKIKYFPPVIAIHTGPNVVGIMTRKAK